jgi:hypothetical protein
MCAENKGMKTVNSLFSGEKLLDLRYTNSSVNRVILDNLSQNYAELTVILNKDNTLRIAHVQWRQKERLRHWRRQKERLIHWQIISGKIYLDWKATLNFYKNVPTSKCYIQLVSRTLDLFNLLRKLREARSKVHAYRRHLVDKTARLLYANTISRVAASPGGNAEQNNAFCGQIHAAAVSQTNNHLFNE